MYAASFGTRGRYRPNEGRCATAFRIGTLKSPKRRQRDDRAAVTETAEPPEAPRAVRSARADAAPDGHGQVDLERYVPAFFTWIANKLARGASQHYLALFDIGIETWRCLVLLAIEGSISAQQVSRVIGMDKSSVSRCFKSMQADGLIRLKLDSRDGRLRIATLTAKGRRLHQQVMGIALERERAFLSVLSEPERESLLELLKRLHENLPMVDRATEAYVARHFPEATGNRLAPAMDELNGQLGP